MTEAILTPPNNDICPKCKGEDVTHKDLGGYAYACIRSTCKTCGHVWEWVDM